MTARKLDVCHPLTLDGEEVDCIITCNVNREEAEVLAVHRDDGTTNAPVPVTDWPADLGEQIHVKALEQSADDDAGYRDDEGDRRYDEARDDAMTGDL